MIRPGAFEHRARLKPVKATAARRAARGLDRFSPRAILNAAGTEKRPLQPNRETPRRFN